MKKGHHRANLYCYIVSKKNLLYLTVFTLLFMLLVTPIVVGIILYSKPTNDDFIVSDYVPDSSTFAGPYTSNEKPDKSIDSANGSNTPITPTPANETYRVTSVTDGDTIKIIYRGIEEKVRLLGIDTPETKDPRKPVQCFGKEASAKTKELLLNTDISVEFGSSQGTRDKYGRLLLYVYKDGVNINKLLVQEGYAYAYTKYPTKYLNDIIELQKAAQSSQKGLWSPNTCGGKP